MIEEKCSCALRGTKQYMTNNAVCLRTLFSKCSLLGEGACYTGGSKY